MRDLEWCCGDPRGDVEELSFVKTARELTSTPTSGDICDVMSDAVAVPFVSTTLSDLPSREKDSVDAACKMVAPRCEIKR